MPSFSIRPVCIYINERDREKERKRERERENERNREKEKEKEREFLIKPATLHTPYITTQYIIIILD